MQNPIPFLSPLQLSIILLSVVFVAGVYLYNVYQERKLRKRIEGAFKKTDDVLLDRNSARLAPEEAIDDRIERGAAAHPPKVPVEPDGEPAHEIRLEPTLGDMPAPAPGPRLSAEPEHPPMAEVPTLTAEQQVPAAEPATPAPAPVAHSSATASAGTTPDVDLDVESALWLQMVDPVGAERLHELLAAKFGKPVRWWGLDAETGEWTPLAPATPGRFSELVGAMLLADRNGPATARELDPWWAAMQRVAAELPATLQLPTRSNELARAQTLDRLCAEVDIQIGFNLLHKDHGQYAGTRLRGVFEANGFKLNGRGAFEQRDEETGTLMFSLVNLDSNHPFTSDSLKTLHVSGFTVLLDVPRTHDPARAYDHLRSLGKRLATTLDALLVDDNRRPLTDQSLSQIRSHVGTTVATLRAHGIEPGSPRALRLFS